MCPYCINVCENENWSTYNVNSYGEILSQFSLILDELKPECVHYESNPSGSNHHPQLNENLAYWYVTKFNYYFLIIKKYNNRRSEKSGPITLKGGGKSRGIYSLLGDRYLRNYKEKLYFLMETLLTISLSFDVYKMLILFKIIKSFNPDLKWTLLKSLNCSEPWGLNGPNCSL